jgi:predicted nucleotidyltransferase
MQFEDLKKKRKQILAVAHKHGAINIRVFGSVVRGEASEKSDIDFLVEAAPKHSPFFPGGLIIDLEELLGCKVDVVEPQALHWYIQERILKEARPL